MVSGQRSGHHFLAATPYQLADVTRGQAITKVLAAGTVQPVVSVVVSSQRGSLRVAVSTGRSGYE